MLPFYRASRPPINLPLPNDPGPEGLPCDQEGSTKRPGEEILPPPIREDGQFADDQPSGFVDWDAQGIRESLREGSPSEADLGRDPRPLLQLDARLVGIPLHGVTLGMAFAVGDWLEHLDAPSMRAEILGVSSQGMWLIVVGERKPRDFPLWELDRWWELFEPPVGGIPAWVHQNDAFVRRDEGPIEARVIFRSSKRSWVSFCWDCPKGGAFEIASWLDFAARWMPEKMPTAWGQLLADLEDADA